MAANKMSKMDEKNISKKYSIGKAFNTAMEHGEGPIWDNVKKCFHWVDLLKGDFYTGYLGQQTFDKVNHLAANPQDIEKRSKKNISTQASEQLNLDYRVNIGQALGAVGLSNTESLVMAAADGFGIYKTENQAFHLAEPIPETLDPKVRFNDGVVGPDGKFYAGTMHWDGEEGFGKL